MNKLRPRIVRLLRKQKGQDFVGYAIAAGFIAISSGALLWPVSADFDAIVSQLGSLLF